MRKSAVAMSHRRGLRASRLFLQVLIYLGRRDGAFADRGGDALDRAVADVAGGEDAGHAGLELEGRAGQVPARRGGGRWPGHTRRRAVAQPDRYRLLFGPPLSGYDAHVQRLIDAAQGSMNLPLDILGADGDRVGLRPPLPLASQLAAWAQPHHPGIDSAIALRAVLFWRRLHGIVSLEIAGNFASVGFDPTSSSRSSWPRSQHDHLSRPHRCPPPHLVRVCPPWQCCVADRSKIERVFNYLSLSGSDSVYLT